MKYHIFLIIIRVITLIPLIYFLIHQWRTHYQNGLQPVRRMTLLLVAAQIFLVGDLLLSRFWSIYDIDDFFNPSHEILRIAIALFVLLATVYAGYLFKSLNHKK